MSTTSSKTILVLLSLTILAIITYVSFFGSSHLSKADDGTTTTMVVSAPAGVAELTAILDKISGTNLDTTFFQSKLFLSLVDYHVELQDQPVGRSNPFAPLGVDSGTLPTSPGSKH